MWNIAQKIMLFKNGRKQQRSVYEMDDYYVLVSWNHFLYSLKSLCIILIIYICVHNYVHVIVQCAQPVPLKEGASSIWRCSWQMTSGLNFKGNVEYRWTRFIQYGRICLNFCVRRKRKKPISCQTKSLDFHESSAEGRLGP